MPLLVGHHGVVGWLQIGRYPRHVISLFFRLLYPWYWPSSCWNFVMTCAMTVYYYILNLLVSSWEKLRRPSHRRTHGEWRRGSPTSSTLCCCCCCSFSFVCASSVVVSSSSLCVCPNSMSCISCCVRSVVDIGRSKMVMKESMCISGFVSQELICSVLHPFISKIFGRTMDRLQKDCPVVLLALCRWKLNCLLLLFVYLGCWIPVTLIDPGLWFIFFWTALSLTWMTVKIKRYKSSVIRLRSPSVWRTWSLHKRCNNGIRAGLSN